MAEAEQNAEHNLGDITTPANAEIVEQINEMVEEQPQEES